MVLYKLGVASFLYMRTAAAPFFQVPLSTYGAGSALPPTQEILKDRLLYGRFLHISDLHPDPFYKYHSSVAEDDACHRGKGPAGVYGAETTSCDSPLSLINETFKWIDENLKDKIDFVVWTGDSARHDNDEEIPRTEKQIQELNRFTVNKFVEVFGKESDPFSSLSVPVVPTWGNNDILPHNIFTPGPNKWTKAFLDIWRPFIPESQRHGFTYGGWFSVEVLPNKLAVFSLNSLYFFENNAVVDGCARKNEPGYAQFEWMRIQLQFLRERSMKAIIIGHVPPARTDGKTAWDETCWQKYNLWIHQFRDVVVGSAWGHMNVDHFMLQDYEEVDIDVLRGLAIGDPKTPMDDEITTASAADYLTELREIWSELPEPPNGVSLNSDDLDATKKSKKDKFYKQIGGAYGERFSLSLVSPSVVPNYYPTLRIVEYNVSGVDLTPSVYSSNPAGVKDSWLQVIPDIMSSVLSLKKHKKKHFEIPEPPSKSSPPGPAYSPQTFTWTKYTQLYANLTIINNDFTPSSTVNSNDLAGAGWKEGKHPNKEPKGGSSPHPKKFNFEVEYDTADDKIYGMRDLTVLSYLKLAERIGSYKPKRKNPWSGDDDFVGSDSVIEEVAKELNDRGKNTGSEVELAKKKRGKHKKSKGKKGKHRKKKLANRAWHAFVKRAFVSSKDEDELRDEFGEPDD